MIENFEYDILECIEKNNKVKLEKDEKIKLKRASIIFESVQKFTQVI